MQLRSTRQERGNQWTDVMADPGQDAYMDTAFGRRNIFYNISLSPAQAKHDPCALDRRPRGHSGSPMSVVAEHPDIFYFDDHDTKYLVHHHITHTREQRFVALMSSHSEGPSSSSAHHYQHSRTLDVFSETAEYSFSDPGHFDPLSYQPSSLSSHQNSLSQVPPTRECHFTSCPILFRKQYRTCLGACLD